MAISQTKSESEERKPVTGRYLYACLLSIVLVACQSVDPGANREPQNFSLSDACLGIFAKSIALYEQGGLESAAGVLAASKRSACITQHELARVDQLLASIYFQLDEIEWSLTHINAAIERDALEAELQKKSLYLAAQLTYLSDEPGRALALIDEYARLVPQLLPAEQVLKARCFHALGRRVEAISIMTSIYARYRSGEIEMEREWLDFFEGIQGDEQPSFG